MSADNNTENLIRLTGGSGYGYTGWKPGEIERNTEEAIRAGQPEWLYVIEEGEQRYSAGGMAAGVGAEAGSLYWAVCRPATPEEAAPAVARRQWMIRRTEAQRQLESVGSRQWLMPDGDIHLEGEAICINCPEVRPVLQAHGETDWLVLGRDWIWNVTVRAPSFAYANQDVMVMFNGCGARTSRMPADAELAERIHALARIAHSTLEDGG